MGCSCQFCVESSAVWREPNNDAARHRIARRVTTDGTHITLWSGGHVFRPLGSHIPGWGSKRLCPAAAWLFMGLVEIYNEADLSRLAAACRWCAKRALSQKDVFKRMDRPARIMFRWRYEYAGVRVSRLNPIQWPGLAVWNERGVYTVMSVTEDRNGDLTGTAVADFRTIKDLTAYLHTIIGRTSSSSATRHQTKALVT